MFKMQQSGPVDAQRRDDRQLGVCQLVCERVLFLDRRIAPAAGAIELGDQRTSWTPTW
jgi:hypothetical protein